MIWCVKPAPRLGDIRVVWRFAWLPTRVGERRVWLSRYWAREVLDETEVIDPPDIYWECGWRETRRGLTRSEALES